jgi:adenine-specific DNA-methyltransferase
MPNLPAKTHRTALEALSRDALASLTTRLNLAVEDRRAQASHVDAIMRSRSVDFGDLLRQLSRDELKAICSALRLETSGRDKESIVQRIRWTAESNTNDGDGVADNGKKQGVGSELKAVEPKGKKIRGSAASRSSGGEPTGDYRHDATRKNNPPAGLIDLEKPPPQPTRRYGYDPHLDPQLHWAGKAEHTSFEVDTVSLHIHERISAQAIMRAVKREDAQRSLFGGDDLPVSKAIDFYAHDVGWANRLVLGDSLLVMNSLLEREQMAGKVQCIYVDPPYGVKFNSNFQPSISRRDVKDGEDASLTREPEQIQAYRDTWTLGIHSYLTYLRDRLLLARDLLHESGSIFVQISDDNVHHVRELMDEVFGVENFASQIAVQKTGGLGTDGLPAVVDYLVWYAKDRSKQKYRRLFNIKTVGVGAGTGMRYDQLESPDGQIRRPMTAEERAQPATIPIGWRPYQLTTLSAMYSATETCLYEFQYQGRKFSPPPNRQWSTNREGMNRLIKAGRVQLRGTTPAYVRYLDDFPANELSNVWDDVAGAPGKVYVVQTSALVIERCILMSTDPGDLVLDPTCGSGTTAWAAEKWGRRWITCDTSRVAVAIARQRMLTANYSFYRLKSERVRDGFYYKSVPHIMLKTIVQNQRLDDARTVKECEQITRAAADDEALYDQPEEDKGKVRVSGPFTVEAIPMASMEDVSESPIPQLEAEARDDDIASPGRGSAGLDAGTEYVAYMIDLLKRSGGVHFKNGKTLPLTDLHSVKTSFDWLHAESATGFGGDDPRRVAVSLGPRHAPVTPKQVFDTIRETRGYDIVLFVGFACDPEALGMIEKGTADRTFQFVHAAPDILVGDLVKTSKTTKLFTVFGLPDVKVKKEKDGDVTITLAGVDIYDPVTGETSHDDGENVAAWFLDHDYDGRTFCVCQAFFPGGKNKNTWEKLQKALKGCIDEDRFESLRGTTSIPFKPGKKVAVKVIDDRGNEVVKMVGV